MTTIAISVDNHSRRTALTVEHMIDAETKECRILIAYSTEDGQLFQMIVGSHSTPRAVWPTGAWSQA